MKNSGTSRKKILIITAILCVITAFVFVVGNYVIKKSYATDSGIKNIASFIDIDDNPTSASFIVENIFKNDKNNIDGFSYEITSNNGTTIDVSDINSNESLIYDSKFFDMDENGVLVKVGNVLKGNTYTIKIQPTISKKGYRHNFKYIEIELDYTDSLSAHISKIVDSNNEEVNVDENEQALFLFTDNDNKIHLRANENTDVYYYYSLNDLDDNALNNIDFVEYDKENYLSIATNGYLYAKSKYKTSGYSKITKLHINNIDKLNPVITVNSVEESGTKDSAIINYNLNDAAETLEYGKSGIKSYYIDSIEAISDNLWNDITDTDNLTYETYDNGVYYIHTKDNAGNTTTQKVDVDCISNESLDYVLIVLESPYQELNGQLFNSFNQMQERFRELNVTSNDHILAQVINNINNQVGIIENVDLKLDLNGYEIKSRKEQSNLTVKPNAKLTIVDNKYRINDYIDHYTASNFDYINGESEFVAPKTGSYKLEVWGASGGSNDYTRGGYGGYSVGYFDLNENDRLYVNVGGQGTGGSTSTAGYNGGGAANHSGSWTRGAGGGATHIALESGLLSTFEDKKDKVLIVAGGGGGAGYYSGSEMSNGGDAGGFEGKTGNGNSSNQTQGAGGTQTSAGTGYENGAFGQGANRTTTSDYGGSGGGAGWYGGGASMNTAGGGGGSSYIGNELLTRKSMYCFKCTESTDESTKTISKNTYSEDHLANTPKVGNGYAIISILTSTFADPTADYSMYHSNDDTGKITNSTSSAIMVEEGGILQIGEDNSPDLVHIEYPNHVTPYIFGERYGIYNNGTFNYYDGVLVGGSSFRGDINDTPPLYDPYVTKDNNNHYYVATLEEVSDVEALIGKTRYTLLENAIAAANNTVGTTNDQIEIDIIKDLAKDDSVYINSNKNIILDLNSHTFTNIASKPVIDNSGRTSIKDSIGGGKISSDSSHAILNTSGYLEINDIDVYSANRDIPSIMNKIDAELAINSGKIYNTGEIHNSRGGSVLYNDGGDLTINGGDFTIYNDDWSSTIYNKDAITDIYESDIPIELYDIHNESGTYSWYENHDYEKRNGILEVGDYSDNTFETSGYYYIDLSNYNVHEQFTFTINVDCNAHLGSPYAYYRTDDERQSYDRSIDGNRFMYISNENVQGGEYSAKLLGGKKYKVHIAYFRSNYEHNDDEYFSINSVRLVKNVTKIGRVTINDGVIHDGQYGLYNDSLFDKTIINGGTFDGKNNIYNVGNYGEIHINGGTFTKNVNNYNRMYVTGGEFNDLNNLRDNNMDGTLYISGGTTKTLHNGNYIDDNKTYITGGTFDGIYNYDYMDIKNATITGFLNIQEFADEMYIDNTNIISNLKEYSVRELVYTKAHTPLHISNSILEFNNYDQSSDMTGILLDADADLTMDNSTLKVIKQAETYYEYNNIGIHSKAGNVTLNNSSVDVTSTNSKSKSYGIYYEGENVITIGSKDGDYSKQSSHVYGTDCGIQNTHGLINFYDGYVLSDNHAVYNSIHDIETNYYVKRDTEDGKEIVYLDNDLYNIIDVDTNIQYHTLKEALAAVGDTANLKYISTYNYETSLDPYTLSTGKNITIDINGSTVYLGNGIVNNGILKFIDTANTKGNIYSQYIINNNKLDIDGGNWLIEWDKDYGILNNGFFVVSNSTIDSVYNEKDKYVINNNGTFTLSTNGELKQKGGGTKLIYNNYTGKVYFTAGTVNQYGDSAYVLGGGKVVYNEGGYVETTNTIMNVDSGGQYQAVHKIPFYNKGCTVDGVEKRATMKIIGTTFNDVQHYNHSGMIIGYNSDIEIVDGTFNGNGVTTHENSTLYVHDGTFTYGTAIISDNSEVTIDNATINSIDSNGVWFGDNVTLTINDINITATQRGIHFAGYGAWGNHDNSDIVVNKATVTTSGKIGIEIGNPNTLLLSNTTVNVSNETDYNTDVFGIYFADGSYDPESKRGTITISNSTIKATATGERMTSYGLFIDDYLGTVNLTNSDGDEDGYVSETSSYIYGDTYGVYRTNGTFNYYDGILRGETQLYGGVSDIPDNYVLYYDEDAESKYVILKKVYVARNTDTDTSYSNVQDAFNSCTDDVECNIEMLYDVNLPAKLEVNEHKIINLNLNEKKILETYDKFIENKGKLTITNGTISTESVLKEQALIDNYNELIISTGAIIKVDGVDDSRTLYNRTDAKLYINDGIVYSTGGYDYNYNGKVLYNNGGYVEINGGTITGDSGYNNFDAIDNITVTIDNVEHRGKIVINGGTIKKASDGKYINAINSDVEMTGGTLTQTQDVRLYEYGIYLTNNATLYTTGGTIEGFDEGIHSEESTVTIDNITLDGDRTAIQLSNHNESVVINDINVTNTITALNLYYSIGVTVNKGTFNTTGSFITVNGYEKNGTVNLNNVKATVNGNDVHNISAIQVNTFGGLTANISNSEIIATNSSGEATGIYLDNIRDEEDDLINITISNNNDEVDTTKSLIYGDTYGIYSDNHYINFYDGVIKGATPIHGVINNRPANYNIYYDTDSDGKNEIYLKEFDVVKNVDTGINYETIQAAFDACEDNTLCNLKLLYNIMPEDVSTVKANKKINFDLNEHNILLHKKKGFVVNGELKLTNGRIHSQSRNDGYYFIENNGKLELGTGFELYNDYLPETKLLKNNYTGNVYINGALLFNTVSGNYISGKIIYNEGGYVEINSGTIEGYTASWKCAVNDIYNTNKTIDDTVHEGHIVLNGGKIHDNNSDYSYYIIDNVGAKFTMNGGEIYSTKEEMSSIAIHGQDNATIIINNGLIHDNRTGVYVNNSNLTMTGEKIYNNYFGIKSESSTVSINEGLLKDNNTGIHIALDESKIGETTLTNSTIISTENAIKIEGNNNLNIISGNYTATGEDGNGLLAAGTGIITIGTNDGVVSISNPHITGVGHGLNITNDDSTVKFYDGVITSNNTIIGGQVDETPTDYKVSAYDSTSYILRIKSDIQDTFEYNGIYFQDIDMPIDMIGNSNTKQGTINLRADVILTKGITIPADIDVTIALYGHTISFNEINTGITNNGTLTIIDGAFDQIDNLTDSRILNQNGTVIVNNGTLTIGAENNPNSQSPKIIGSTGYSGNTPTVKSGSIQSTSDNSLFSALGSALNNMFAPSYSYVHKEYEVFNVNDDVALTSSPLIKSKTPTTIMSNGVEFINWTNQNVDVGLTTHNYGVLNIVSEVDPDMTKQMSYRVEVYKNEALDEFNSKTFTKEVQYLSNTIPVDLDWFEGAETKFKGYTLIKMIVNNDNTRIIPSEVQDNTVIKLYYVRGDVRGVELVNPRTGTKSYIKVFIGVLVLFVIGFSFFLYKYKKLNRQ